MVFKIKSVLKLLGTALVAVGLLLAGCRRADALPEAARDALEAVDLGGDKALYLEQLGFEQVIEIEVSRAWRAENLPPGIAADQGNVQVWCVELAVKGQQSGAVTVERPIWVAIQQGEDSEWSVQPLAMFSSLWPYESCGRSPGD